MTDDARYVRQAIQLARQALQEHQQTTNRHALQLDTSLDKVVGVWDLPRLERVFNNLLGNAIKYSPEGGVICVQVHSEGGLTGERWAVVRVTDQGEGIPEVDLPHIFERFRRGANVEGRIPGTGIGLAGARRILEQHGGGIGVESRVGRGTTFTIRLPIDDAATA